MRHRWMTTFLGLIVSSATAASPSAAATSSIGWTVVQTPHDAGETYIYDVSTLSSRDAWNVGVGFTRQGEDMGTVGHWDGTAWTTQETPEIDDSYLSGVDALSDSDVWAVGRQDGPNETSSTVTEHLNGTGWSRVASPNPSKDPLYGENELYDVAAISADDVWAAGYVHNDDLYSELLLHWNGTSWKVWPAPRTGYRQLASISDVSSADIWTVGFEFTFGLGYQPLIEHWNGTRWSRSAVPTLPGGYAFLNGVAAVSSNDVWAVGSSSEGTTATPLILHWDGTAWTQTPSPPTPRGYLRAVAAVSATNVWAVGYRSLESGQVTMSQHWDGTRWSTVATPTFQGASCELYGAAPDGAGGVWGVGTAYPRPLAMRSHM